MGRVSHHYMLGLAQNSLVTQFTQSTFIKCGFLQRMAFYLQQKTETLARLIL